MRRLMSRPRLGRAQWEMRRLVSHLSLEQLASSRTFSLDKTSFLPSLWRRLHGSSVSHTGFRPAEQMMGLTSINRLDPHTYTSGRWLHRDKLERDSRYITFDFDALCRRVVELCPGAVSIATYDKIEGGYNRVFIFTTDNGKRVVAKLPFALAGPPRLTTNSEVATIQYRESKPMHPRTVKLLTTQRVLVQANTSIPIPKILDWSDDASTAIGSEYIIMEHAAGVQLHQKWPLMAGDQQIRCIEAIYRKVKEIVDMKIPAYGSLYFVDAPLNSASKLPLNQDLCVGPHCGARYWNCNVGEPRYYHNTKPNRGPWFDLAAYCDGLVDTGLSRISPADPALQNRPRYQGSPQAHLHLLKSGRTVMKKMSEDPRIWNAATPTLFHPDLHQRNIFVSDDDPAIITDIIDWQSSSIEPAFWYADEVPDFARPVAHPSLKDQFEPNSERCAKAFEICTQFLVPKLAGPRLMDEALFRPFRYCHRTWKDGAVAFRHELIETSQSWKELGLPGSCPFPIPAPAELAVHQKKYKFFEAAHQLKRVLPSLLDTTSDGWVPPEDWEATESAHREMFGGMLQAILTNENPDDDEPIRDEEDLREIWPFDL